MFALSLHIESTDFMIQATSFFKSSSKVSFRLSPLPHNVLLSRNLHQEKQFMI